MYLDASKATARSTPGGSSPCSSSISAFTPSATSRVLALLCLTMPRPNAGLLFTRTTLRRVSAPTSTRATSERRTSWPAKLPMIRSRKSSTLCSSPRLRTGELGVGRLDASRRDVHVLAPERGLDVGDGDAERGHHAVVEPQPHRIAPLAGDDHGGDTGQLGQAVHQPRLGQRGQLDLVVALAGERQPHDGVRVRVALGDDRVVHLLGQVAACLGDAIAHVVGGDVDVDVQVELDRHDRGLLAALGGDVLHAGDAVDAVLEDVRHRGLDDLRRGARKNRGHRHDRRIDVRQLAVSAGVPAR